MSQTSPKAPEGQPTTCPWCSASVPAASATCPSCGAALKDSVEGEVLGVTQIDPSAIVRTTRPKPGRLATWLGAEPPDEPDLGGRIEPPSKEVREEMLRLEIAAIDAEIEARATRAEAQRQLEAEEAAKVQDAPEVQEVPEIHEAPEAQDPPGAEGSRQETEPS
jgi:hypothetical protein